MTVERTGPVSGPVEAWLQWDDTPLGFLRRGRQSHFANCCYERFDAEGLEILNDPASASKCPIRRAGSMNAFATGRHTVVVGGYVGDIRPAKYSAGGPITPILGATSPHRPGPDMMATSDDSIVQLGILAAGTRSGSMVSLNGTSVAAPQITRKLADEFSKRSPERNGPSGSKSSPPAPNPRAGLGLIETERRVTRGERLGSSTVERSRGTRGGADAWEWFISKWRSEVAHEPDQTNGGGPVGA